MLPEPAWEAGLTTLPNTPTYVVSIDAPNFVRVDALVLANITGSAVTVTVTSGNGLDLFPAVSIAGNTVYTVDLEGLRAYGGVLWSASQAGAVNGYIGGR